MYFERTRAALSFSLAVNPGCFTAAVDVSGGFGAAPASSEVVPSPLTEARILWCLRAFLTGDNCRLIEQSSHFIKINFIEQKELPEVDFSTICNSNRVKKKVSN